jgi:hypothetical protein
LKAKILSYTGAALPYMQEVLDYLEKEIKRPELNLLERFVFESSKDDVLILIKQLTAVEIKMKAT